MTEEQKLFEKFKGKRVEFKDGPFKYEFGAFIPDLLKDGLFYGHFEKKPNIRKTWVALWPNETADNNHWVLAPEKVRL